MIGVKQGQELMKYSCPSEVLNTIIINQRFDTVTIKCQNMLGYLSTARSKQFSYSETQRKVLALAYFTPNSGYCVYNLSDTFFF